MSKKVKILFFVMVLTQGLHSIEEYLGRLWENFPPATALTGFVSDNLETGFLIINIGLFAFGIVCGILLIFANHKYTEPLVWFWIILEFINGIGHPIWSVLQGGYTPGLFTAPVLLLLVILILKQLKQSKIVGIPG